KMFLLWLFGSVMSVFHLSSGESVPVHTYSSGDIIIGGLFPMHAKTNKSTAGEWISCREYDLQMFLRTHVMIYAIREINQRTQRVLPNITLGYDIYDTCSDVSVAIRATLQLLNNPQSCLLPARIHSALPEPQIKAVIGERSSETSIAVARVLALTSVAQVYGSTSEVLSRKLKFPTFLRTIPSDEYQTKAIVELVKRFNWKSVAVVGSDDEYGKYGSDRLVDHFRKLEICIEFTEILPSHFSMNDSDTFNCLANLSKSINKSTAEAIILFTRQSNVEIIIERAIERKFNRTWIASDAWSTSKKISEMQNLKLAGKVFGFISKRNEVPGFKDYILSLLSRTTNATPEEYPTQYPLCTNQSEESKENNCQLTNHQDNSNHCLDLRCLANYIDQDESYNIYLAVQVIVEALRRLFKCENQQCERRNTSFTAAELLMEIQKVNFTVNSTHIYFNDKGDPYLGYDILYWNTSEPTQHAHITTIGEYSPNKEITLSNEFDENTNVISTFDPILSFADPSLTACQSCGKKKHSAPLRDSCLNKTLEFLLWTDPFIIILSAFNVFGIIVTIVLTILFTIYRSTPIVKSVGGYLCFLELFSLLTCFCLAFSFMGRPTKNSCMLGLPLFGITFSLCISCILANLLQILVGFSFDLKKDSWLRKLNRPLAVVSIVAGIQLGLCVAWVYNKHPFLQHDIRTKIILLQCHQGSTEFFLAMLGYNALLAFICFLFAFNGKQLPDLYKNATLVSISMLLFLIIWIIFIPIYINLSGKYKRAIECAAILISSYSILGCHLAPKCYIMVCRKELNNENAITEYIRKHYEEKNMVVWEHICNKKNISLHTYIFLQLFS
uniref:G-protein coupled receptors family 3 profile domain-containing protein n=1 Tax=Echeneis naucrates TaxID=173247 RepID=A0A665V502_ECHNA